MSAQDYNFSQIEAKWQKNLGRQASVQKYRQ